MPLEINICCQISTQLSFVTAVLTTPAPLIHKGAQPFSNEMTDMDC